MSILENIRKLRNEAKPASGPEKSVPEILNDPHDSRLFADFLMHSGGRDIDLLERLRLGDIDPGDARDLDDRKMEFIHRMNEAKKIANFLSPDMATTIASTSPEFKKILSVLGPQKAVNMWKEEIYNIAINHETHFTAIANQMTLVSTRDEDETKRVEDVVEKYQKSSKMTGRKKFNAERYAKIMALPEKEQRVAWSEVARESYGGFRKRIDTYTGGLLGWSAGRRQSKTEQAAIAAAFEEKDDELEVLGSVLDLTVTGNPLIREAFKREMVNAKKPENKDLTFIQSGEYLPKEADVLAEWNKSTRPKYFEIKTPAEQEMYREAFCSLMENAYLDALNTATGSWAHIAAPLVSFAIQRMRPLLV